MAVDRRWRRDYLPGNEVSRLSLRAPLAVRGDEALGRQHQAGDAGGVLQRAANGTHGVDDAHGKQMMFEFSGGAWLGLHLGMSGELFAGAPEYEPQERDHLVLGVDAGRLVFSDYRMFGKLTLDVREDWFPPDWWHNLPPRLTESGFTKKRHADFVF